MDERMRFVIRLKDGETMASLRCKFGMSRKIVYKILERSNAMSGFERPDAAVSTPIADQHFGFATSGPNVCKGMPGASDSKSTPIL